MDPEAMTTEQFADKSINELGNAIVGSICLCHGGQNPEQVEKDLLIKALEEARIPADSMPGVIDVVHKHVVQRQKYQLSKIRKRVSYFVRELRKRERIQV